MAKIQDKLYNRVIEGKLLELSDEDLKTLRNAKISQTPSYELGDEEEIENVIDSLRVGDTLSITGTLYVVTYIDSAQVNLLQLDGLGGSLDLDYLTYDKVSKDLSTDSYHLATQNDVGNKLYRHHFVIKNEPATACSIDFISTEGTQFNPLIGDKPNNNKIISVLSGYDQEDGLTFIGTVDFGDTALSISGYAYNDESAYVKSFTYINYTYEDTVTPL